MAMREFCRRVLLGGRKPDPRFLRGLDEALEEAAERAKPMRRSPMDAFLGMMGGADPREVPEVLVQAILDHAGLAEPQQARMMANLLAWASRTPWPPQLAYQRAAAFLAGRGNDLAPFAVALALEDPFAEPDDAVANFAAALPSPKLDADARLYLFLAYPNALWGTHATKRAQALRAIAERFFQAPFLAEVTRRAAEARVNRERPDPVEAVEAGEPEAWLSADLDDAWWVPPTPPEPAVVLRHLAAKLHPPFHYKPYREALARTRALRGDLAAELKRARGPREAIALLNLIAGSWRPDLEPAVAKAAKHREPFVRAAAFEVLLVRGRDPEPWVRRCMADSAGSVRKVPLRVAISRQKHATMEPERRRALLALVKTRKGHFEWLPRQRSAFQKLCREHGV